MAELDKNLLEHLKKLCRIECEPEKDQYILDSLGRVLKYVEQLNAIDTDNVKPCRYVLRGMLRNPMRDDAISDTLPKETFLNNAPDQIGGMIRVPKVLKESS